MMAEDFSVSIQTPSEIDKMVTEYTLERAGGFKDLVAILNSFSVTNIDEVVRGYSRERMLKITALKMRKFLWTPNQRD